MELRAVDSLRHEIHAEGDVHERHVARPSIVCRCSRGRQGESEAGPWNFWTLESDKGPPLPARCRPGEDPGKRFREIKDRPVEAKFWPRVEAATKIRPSTQQEVEDWLYHKDHK